MAINNYLDITEEINANGSVILDVGGYISGTVYIYGQSKECNFSCTNYGGEEEGTISGSPLTADNFTAIRMLNLTTNSYSSDSGASTDVIFKFNKIGKYLKIISSNDVTSMYVQLFKII